MVMALSRLFLQLGGNVALVQPYDVGRRFCFRRAKSGSLTFHEGVGVEMVVLCHVFMDWARLVSMRGLWRVCESDCACLEKKGLTG